MARGVGRLTSGIFAIVLTASLVLGAASTAAGAKKQNHCINPVGIDLNEFFGTQDAFITPFCTTAHTGDKWRPFVRWVVADTFEVIPEGYVPARPTPLEDFLSKFVSVRYVIDAGTKKERTFEFAVSDLILSVIDLPDNTSFVGFTPRLRPLPPGNHSIDIFITVTAETWDGLGLEPGVNSAPAGESPSPSVEFRVVNRGRKK